MTICLLIDCRDISDESLCRLLDRLSPDRLEKARSFGHYSARLMSAVAGYCMKLLEEKFECGSVIDEYGKPQLTDCLHHFNVSHSAGFVAVAWSDLPVGVDVQGIIKDMKVAERVLTENEMKIFSKGRDPAVLTRFWTRKESYLKLTGNGLRTDPRMVEVIDDDGILACPLCSRLSEVSNDSVMLCVNHLDQKTYFAGLTIEELLQADHL